MYMYIYQYRYIKIIYTTFVNGIPARDRAPDDPDLFRLSGPTKVAQALAR